MKKIIFVLFLLFQNLICSYALDKNNTGFKPNLDFWQNFNDEILIQNITKGYENNLDLKIADYKIKQSEKIVKLSLSQELPQINFDGLIGRTFASSDLERGDNNFMINNYKQTRFLLPINVSWELDIWGKNRLKTKSKKQSLKIIEQDKKATAVLLETSIAADYYSLVKVDKLLELNNELYELNLKLLNLVSNKQIAGLASEDDVLTINEILLENKKNIYELENKKEVLENQIGYLLGDKLFQKIDRVCFDDIKFIENIPQQLDSSVILNRPDVISASENIIKANYDAKIAKKDLLPSFTIEGTFGFNGYTNLSRLFKGNTGMADLWVQPNFNIFDGGKKYNVLKLKQLEYEQIKQEYNKAVINSIKEVNDSLAVLKKENKTSKLSKQTVKILDKKTNLKLANKNFGLASEIDYILYQSANNIARQKYVSDKINYVVSIIGLYKSTGGTNYIENL